MKRCQTCKQEKTLDSFYNSKATKDGLYPRCKDCDRIARHLWDVRNPDKSKQSKHYRRIKHLYGVSREEYDLRVHQQQGCCAICGTETAWNLAVDHCHETNRIRGLLCNTCNRALGLFKDSPTIIHNAYEYLNNSLKGRISDFTPR